MMPQTRFLSYINKVNTPYVAQNRKDLVHDYRARMRAFSRASKAEFAYWTAGDRRVVEAKKQLDTAAVNLGKSFSDEAVKPYMPAEYLDIAHNSGLLSIVFADEKESLVLKPAKIARNVLAGAIVTFATAAVCIAPTTPFPTWLASTLGAAILMVGISHGVYSAVKSAIETRAGDFYRMVRKSVENTARQPAEKSELSPAPVPA